MTTYRVGNHWGVTIVREGRDPALGRTLPEHMDQLVAVVVNGDEQIAERICALLNGDQGPRPLTSEVLDMTPEEFEQAKAAFLAKARGRAEPIWYCRCGAYAEHDQAGDSARHAAFIEAETPRPWWRRQRRADEHTEGHQ